MSFDSLVCSTTPPLRAAPLLALALLAGPALAQDRAVDAQQAPTALLQPLNLRDGTLQNLDLPALPGAPFAVDVVLGGVQQRLLLRPHDVRSPRFQMLVDDGKAVYQIPTPPSVTFRGTVAGMDDSVVAAALIDGQLQAAVHTATETWWIQPATDAQPGLPRSLHVVASHADTVLPGVCGVEEHHVQDRAPAAPPAPPSSAMKVAEVALDVTNDAYVIMGQNTTNVNNQMTSLMNVVDTVYQRDVQIQKSVVAMVIRTTKVYQFNTTVLLGLVSTRWINQHGLILRDMVHAIAGNPSSSVLGIANLSVVCNYQRHYGVSWWFGGLNARADIVCHEMGHNWSAPHCDNFTPCWTMCSGNIGCPPLGQLRFAPVSVNHILNHKNTRTCLSDPSPPVLTSISPTEVTSYQPSLLTLTGTGLEDVDSLSVGGTPITAFTVNGSTQITFNVPSPFDINTHPVVVSAGGLTSNSVNLTVTGNHPSVYIAPAFHPRGFPIDYTVHTDRNWLATMFLSSLNTPSSFPSIVVMEIGGNFSNLIQVTTLFADNTGTAVLPLNWPTTIPPQTVFTEFITYTPTSTLPLETSNHQATTLL